MVGLTLSGKIYKRHFDGSVNAEKLIVGLEHLRRHIKAPFIVIWDRSSTHRAKVVKAYLEKHPEVHIEYLPPYASELNPEEYCHGNVKRRMKNGIYHQKLKFVKTWMQALLAFASDRIFCKPVFVTLALSLNLN